MDHYPKIINLSNNSSEMGKYVNIRITCENLIDRKLGFSLISFGNIKNIPICYLSESEILFVIPNNLSSGKYELRIINIVNSLYPYQFESNVHEYTIL